MPNDSSQRPRISEIEVVTLNSKDKGIAAMVDGTRGNRQPASGQQEKKSSITLEPHQVVLRPLVTEKGMHRSSRQNQYSFEVNPLADKDDIRKAIEDLFDVKVVKVRTQNRKGKPRRYRYTHGYTKNWKKAIITLEGEHRIDFF